MRNSVKLNALRAAFPFTVPILTGFIFLGMAYGILMSASGFNFLYPLFMSMTIFAGSMEFVTVSLLLTAFNPLKALALTLMVNARHLFYGISMLEKYKNTGHKKAYLIFGMCDESFSINCTVNPPLGIDRGWFMFFVTLLNQFYWVSGATLGGICGNFLHFNTKGLDFVMTGLFIVIFLEQWLKKPATDETIATTGTQNEQKSTTANTAVTAFVFRNRFSGALGILFSVLSLVIFGGDSFIIPAMIAIIVALALLQKPLERGSFAKRVKKGSTSDKNGELK